MFLSAVLPDARIFRGVVFLSLGPGLSPLLGGYPIPRFLGKLQPPPAPLLASVPRPNISVLQPKTTSVLEPKAPYSNRKNSEPQPKNLRTSTEYLRTPTETKNQ